MRRSVGVGAIQRKKEAAAKFKEKASDMASEHLQRLSTLMETFKEKIEVFASKYNDEIRRNPQFRKQFQVMCASMGVDPLASSKGFWAEKFGFGKFYYELAIKITEICMATCHINGGLITTEELVRRLARSGSSAKRDIVDNDDILKAVNKLKVLGGGFTVIRLSGDKCLIQYLPKEISMDHTFALQLAQENVFVTVEELMNKWQWSEERAVVVLGFAWIDSQSSSGVTYWFPTFFVKTYDSSLGGDVAPL